MASLKRIGTSAVEITFNKAPDPESPRTVQSIVELPPLKVITPAFSTRRRPLASTASLADQTLQLFRPAALDSYSAVSARLRSWSASQPVAPSEATPKLAVMRTAPDSVCT